ncbi:uncharacterized protein RJT20DRAFT_91822 [Scheffersomyces xylosifermentans]|uniref:uncharacterized protein n=1 Tax=Scheffersomyces xylosifermentans TaxID=1304137 RepID=UPI00315C6C62
MQLINYFQSTAEKWEVPHEIGDRPTALKNPDLEPMKPDRRIWGFWSFFGYWGVPNITIWTWSTGSAMLSLGLNIGHTMGALTLANILICVYTCLNSGPGSKYHIGYTICQRMIFGIYGSYLGILIRIILSIVFYGSQSWLGGLGVVVVFSSLSENYLNMKNTFPESIAMTTRDFIGFFVFQILQFFFYFMRPEKMNKYVNFSCFITFISFVAILIACLMKNHGPGPIYYEKVSLKKSEIGWNWLYSMTIWYGALSPDCTNQSDYSRFASHSGRMYAGIITSVMTTGTFVPLAGLLCASATKQLYNNEMWLPTDICLQWLNDNYSSGCRAAVFFLGFSFAASQLTFNVVANGFAGGMDLAGIFPQYIDIKRGAIITAVLSWVVQPWNFYNTSSVFISVMSSFGVVVTPIIAIVVTDYHVVRRRRLCLSDLFSQSAEGTYYFTKGVNFRAISVWIVSVVPGLPGLVNQVNHINIPQGLNNFFFGNIIFGFVLPSIVYYLVCRLFPPKCDSMDDEDIFGAFTEREKEVLGMALYSTTIESLEGVEPDLPVKYSKEEKGEKTFITYVVSQA